jgi:hypothetical protein
LDAPARHFVSAQLPAPHHTIVETVGHRHITHPNDPKGRTYAEAIAEKLSEKALAGDIRAAQEIDRQG